MDLAVFDSGVAGMKRAQAASQDVGQEKRSKALREQHELQMLLKSLGIGLYPTRASGWRWPAISQSRAGTFRSASRTAPQVGKKQKRPRLIAGGVFIR